MNLENALGIYPQSLMLREKRSEILASNLANADTPGYKARDFDFHQVLRQEMTPPTRLRATHERHIQPDTGVLPANLVQYRVPEQPSLDGNTVNPQHEYVAFSENSLGYQTSLQLVNKKIKGLMTAIKGQ
jgi:flagellar basal-body rod protein FlgB